MRFQLVPGCSVVVPLLPVGAGFPCFRASTPFRSFLPVQEDRFGDFVSASFGCGYRDRDAASRAIDLLDALADHEAAATLAAADPQQLGGLIGGCGWGARAEIRQPERIRGRCERIRGTDRVAGAARGTCELADPGDLEFGTATAATHDHRAAAYRGSTHRILATMDVAAVIVGDEVLAGHVTDANGALLAQTIRGAGHRLLRIGVVSDEIELIARELQLARSDGAGLVITSGGIGPTHDDVTLEGVALGMGLPLEECVPMRARIDGWIDRATSAGISEAALGADWLRRMALAPRGAELLECSMAVPAFAISDDEGTVCVLPGPPTQFAAALQEAVVPRFLGTPDAHQIEEVMHAFPESMLAATLAELATEHRDVKIGSYPQGGRTLVRINGTPDSVRAAVERLRVAIIKIELGPDGQAVRGVLASRRREAGD